MDLRRLIGQNVRTCRTRLGISQEELAFRANLHRTYVSGVERGVRNPTVLIVGRLAKALNVPPPMLLQAKPQSSRHYAPFDLFAAQIAEFA
jgi:transcriptional regulator with XRE-family HTH domain